MATRSSVNQKRKNQSSTTNQSEIREKIEPVGSKVLFEPEANTAKNNIAIAATTEDVVNPDSETVTSPLAVKSTPPEEVKVEKPTAKAKKSTSGKKSQKTKAQKEPEQEEAEKGELVKTTVYIKEENFLALEDIQLKLKRQEKRRVTKNELFNTAVELLVKHYSD